MTLSDPASALPQDARERERGKAWGTQEPGPILKIRFLKKLRSALPTTSPAYLSPLNLPQRPAFIVCLATETVKSAQLGVAHLSLFLPTFV